MVKLRDLRPGGAREDGVRCVEFGETVALAGVARRRDERRRGVGFGACGVGGIEMLFEEGRFCA